MPENQKLREALQAYQDANEMSPYGDYSKIEWESSAGPVNPSWGGGDCKKHGRWYGRCYSCSDEWDNLRKKADRDAYTARENALNAAKQLAHQALATTEPEPTGVPELPEPDSYEFQHEETGNTMFVDRQQVEWGFEKNNPRLQKIAGAYTTSQMRAYGEQCWKAGYKHGAWGDKPAVNQQLTTEPIDEREAFTDDTRDAARYRWLASSESDAMNAKSKDHQWAVTDAWTTLQKPGADKALIDAAIDAAMAQGVKG